MRRRALLALSVPVAATGCVAGHAAGYVLAGMSRQDARVHGYLGYAPQFLAVGAAFVTVALALRASGRFKGRPAAWPFALLPPLAFVAQELIERAVAGLPVHAAFEPAVFAGLATQLPIAFLAYRVARALLRVADAAGRALRSAPRFTFGPAPVPVPVPVPTLARAMLAFDRLGRAPPRR